MSSSLLIIFYFAITSSYGAEQDSWNCTVPPVPKNGYIEVMRPEKSYVFLDANEIKKYKSYYLKFGCFDGFGHLGPDTQTCFEDGRTEYADFECLPLCSLDSTTSLVSCGAQSRCLMPSKVLGYESRLANAGAFANQSEECGVTSWQQLRRRRYTANNQDGKHRASNGRRVNPNEFPWHAGIYTRKTRPYMQICGGTLVSPKVVISAAHCFWGEDNKQLPATDYAVAVSKLYRPWNEANDAEAQKSDVSEIRIPSHFRGHITNLQDDIALVIVNKPFIYSAHVRPVCLDFNVEMDQEQLSPGRYGTVAGWGLTSADGAASPTLQVVNLPVLNISECFDQSDASFRAHITSDKFCAGLKNGTAVCKGDSGGGLYFSDWSTEVIRYYLRGVVSGAPQNEHLCNVYSWASFTHVQKHEQFILDTLQAVDTLDIID